MRNPVRKYDRGEYTIFSVADKIRADMTFYHNVKRRALDIGEHAIASAAIQVIGLLKTIEKEELA